MARLYDLLRRFLLFVLGTTGLVVAVSLILIRYDLLPDGSVLGELLRSLEVPGQVYGPVVGVSAGLGLLCVGLGLAGGMKSRSERWLLVSKPIAEAGLPSMTVQISELSVRALIAHVGAKVPGVRELIPRVSLGKKGWDISCEVMLWGEAAVPGVSSALRSELHQTVLHQTGVAIDRLDFGFRFVAADHAKTALQ